MRVYTVSCPPAEAVARCVAFWRAIGIKRESTTMCKRFADIGWSGTEVTVMPGQVTTSRRRFDDTFLELGEVAVIPFLRGSGASPLRRRFQTASVFRFGLPPGGIACFFSLRMVRLYHYSLFLSIIISAHTGKNAGFMRSAGFVNLL